MNIIKSEQLIPVDIDNTLIFWRKAKRGEKTLRYTCPYTKEQFQVVLHQPNIAIVKERLARGATILFWSASGYQKAAAVVKALGIVGPGVLVASKPVGYLDDIACEEWMGKRIYLEPDCGYGV